MKIKMKIKIIPWLILLSFLITQFSGYEFFELNQSAITISKKLLVGGSFDDKNIFSVSQKTLLKCHYSWLKLVDSYLGQDIRLDDPVFEEVISCSPLFMHMLKEMIPANLQLASLANQIHPDNTFTIHWIIEIIDPGISIQSKPLIEKILSIDPKDGVAWRYLGIIYLKEGNIPLAIDAHINCCLNGDPGVNGCFNAGRLLEEQGDYDEALYYYRLSRWIKSQEAADKLEASLHEK
jgi:tetratricopeptide (TPR) repeat protein